MYVIYRFIADRTYFWNTCGWTQLGQPRFFTHDDARTIQEKMSRFGRVNIALATKRGLRNIQASVVR